VTVNFKLLVDRLIKILFEQKQISQKVIFIILENMYQDNEYYSENTKLYKKNGYKRVMEII
jgi:hypothetical protein